MCVFTCPTRPMEYTYIVKIIEKLIMHREIFIDFYCTRMCIIAYITNLKKKTKK